MKTMIGLIEESGKQRIFEAGCGEGQNMGVLYQMGYDCKGMDINPRAVELASRNFCNAHMDIEAKRGNIYQAGDLPHRDRMIICLEVLEHLEEPERALKNIVDATDEYFIVSVPREPLWRILNFFRGKYVSSFGNTPGHINHWSKRNFVKLCKQYAVVVKVKSPLPWTMILCKRKNK